MDRLKLISELYDELDGLKSHKNWRVQGAEWDYRQAMFKLIRHLAKEATFTWWTDEDGVYVLKQLFPENHGLWDHLKLKTATTCGRGFESGYLKCFTVKGTNLAVPTNAKGGRVGHERGSVMLETPLGEDGRYVEIYRNAHDNVRWGYIYKFTNPGKFTEDRFQGAYHERIEDVILTCVCWLSGASKDDPDTVKTAKDIVQFLEWSDKVPDDIAKSSYIARGGK